jgi:hypothetical protein
MRWDSDNPGGGDVIDWLVGAAFMLLVLVILALKQQVSGLHRRIAELEAAVSLLSERHAEDYRLSIDAAYGVGRRLADTEKRVRETAERQSQLENLQSADVSSRGAQRIRAKTSPPEAPTRNEAKLAALLRNDESQEP